ncbi:unnamed protein product [Urochloa humidicola]
MALRYLARRVGVPALCRASGPRVSPSTASGPLASRSSQAGYSNGDAAWKKRLGQSLAEKNGAEVDIDEVAEFEASFQATREVVEHARRMEKLKWRFFLGSGAAGAVLGLSAVSYLARQAAVVVGR